MGAGTIRYIEPHPGYGFTIHLNTTTANPVEFDYEVELGTPGGAPTLQMVTTAGNITTDSIAASGFDSRNEKITNVGIPSDDNDATNN